MSAWLLEFATNDEGGLAGFVRLEVPPGASDALAWYWTYLVGVPDVDGIIVVRDHEVPVPRQGLEIRTDGLWAELFCETPKEHWTFGCEAFGVRIDAPEDARRPGGEIGERVAVGLDLEWEAPHVVHGDVLVGRERWTIDAAGRFVEGHELRDDVVTGSELARVLVPLDRAVCERVLVRDDAGARRWSQRVVANEV